MVLRLRPARPARPGLDRRHRQHHRLFAGLADLDVCLNPLVCPWRIIDGDRLRSRYVGLRERYPERSLVPFAIRQDDDDVACWDIATGNVVIVHDFASPGYEQRSVLSDFYAWFRQAIEDFIEFE